MIFLLSALGISLASLLVIWIGSKVYISIKRQNKKFDIEEDVYKLTRKEIKKQEKRRREDER